jgi:glycosyltransferase involved in cell wall biosynthesis
MASISIVIPAYNEQGNIEEVVSQALSVLNAVAKDYEVLVVNDGSTDDTGKILDRLAQNTAQLRVIHHLKNKGVGEALKTLYANARGDYIFTLPGDGQVKAQELPKFLPFTDRLDIIVGNRQNRVDPLYRLINARLYNLALRLLFGLRVHDVDSVKLYKGEIFDNIQIESSGALGEAEILVKAKDKGYRIGEIDIEHYPRTAGKQTGAKLSVIVRAMWELLVFWTRYQRRRLKSSWAKGAISR